METPGPNVQLLRSVILSYFFAEAANIYSLDLMWHRPFYSEEEIPTMLWDLCHIIVLVLGYDMWISGLMNAIHYLTSSLVQGWCYESRKFVVCVQYVNKDKSIQNLSFCYIYLFLLCLLSRSVLFFGSEISSDNNG